MKVETIHQDGLPGSWVGGQVGSLVFESVWIKKLVQLAAQLLHGRQQYTSYDNIESFMMAIQCG